ncbi:MAG TPA: squalene--hopene cyclase [Planctomycetaceae bacterium]|nr:squalene--hopene cyclase [Planctomycetaceae bacterium]
MAEYSFGLFKEESPVVHPPVSRPVVDERFAAELKRSIASTRQFFFNHQHPDGYWVGELEGDVLLESETILLLTFLGEEESELAKGCAKYLVEKQLPEGGWGMYQGAKADICNTVKAYFALKLTGHDPSAEYMQRARKKVMALGGADKVNSFTRFYLAVLGQIPHSICPAVPPQMLLLPDWSPVNIHDMSSWSRTIFVPLSIVSALTPVRPLPPERGIRELFMNAPEKWGPIVAPGKEMSKSPFSWDFFFRTCDKLIWFCRKTGFTPFRNKAIKAAEKWMLEHNEGSDGPGAIYPPIIWEWIALKALGYADDTPEIRYCREQLEALVVRNPENGHLRLQPCKSPVWDTTLTLKALMLGGLTTDHPDIRRAVRWVRDRQITKKGDWAHKVDAEPGGWCFEFNNDFYPDNDDTAMALMVLAGRFDETVKNKDVLPPGAGAAFGRTDEKGNLLPPDLRLLSHAQSGSMADAKNETLDLAKTAEALERGLKWLLAMQNRDGGWGAFDRNNDKEFLCRVPFADHNAMIDPSTPDLTGRVMESLGRLGFRVGTNKQIDRVVAYMRKCQRPDGSWFGRWGINYIYGTWQALTGMTAVGVPTDDPAIRAGANWLLSHQHSSGGWGETADSYEDEALRGQGEPTASQTAWAVMGLIAAGLTDHPATIRGIRFLMNRRRPDGTWQEDQFTGGGFPRVFYLKYHYYSVYFPLMALSLFAAKTRGTAAIALGAVTDAALGAESVRPLEKIYVFAPETASYNNVRNPQPPVIRLYQG